MRPALLILMMDFLVASLLLYVTDTVQSHEHRKVVSTPSALAIQSDSIWAEVANMEEKWDKEDQAYYADLAMQDNDEKFKSLQNDNIGLVAKLEQSHQSLEAAEKKAENISNLLNEKISDIELLSEKTIAYKQNIEDQKHIIEKVNQSIEDKDHTIYSMQSITEKAAEDVRQANLKLLEKAEEVERHLAEKNIIAKEAEVAKGQTEKLENELAHEKEYLEKIERELAEEKVLRLGILEKTSQSIEKLSQEEESRYLATIKKIDGLEESQESLRSALKNAENKIEQLPEKFIDSTKAIIADSQKSLDKNDMLQEQIKNLLASVNPAVSSELFTKIDSINERNKKIEDLVQNLQAGKSTESIEQTIKSTKNANEEQSVEVGEIDKLAAPILANTNNIFKLHSAAQVEINGNLTSEGILWGENKKQVNTFAINVSIGEKSYVIAHASTIGFDDTKVNLDKIIKADYSLRLTPTDSVSMPESQPIDTACEIIAIPTSKGGAPLLLYKTIAEMRDNALGQLNIFQQEIKTSYFKVEQGVTLSEIDKTLTINRSWLDNLTEKTKPGEGDFVVSTDGHFIGVMKDRVTCILITESDLENLSSSINFSTPISFGESVKNYRDSCKKH